MKIKFNFHFTWGSGVFGRQALLGHFYFWSSNDIVVTWSKIRNTGSVGKSIQTLDPSWPKCKSLTLDHIYYPDNFSFLPNISTVEMLGKKRGFFYTFKVIKDRPSLSRGHFWDFPNLLEGLRFKTSLSVWSLKPPCIVEKIFSFSKIYLRVSSRKNPKNDQARPMALRQDLFSEKNENDQARPMADPRSFLKSLHTVPRPAFI